ncbi:MAG: glutathionylspermidine synthase family protein [Chitinophagales bacterium]
MDNRLIAVPPLPRHELRKEGLEWFVADENEGYLCDDFVQITRAELDNFRAASAELFGLAMEAAQRIVDRKAWEDAGIPENAVSLIAYSLQHEKDNYLVGRFDFAGGIDRTPLKMLEINADTCSLMPETAFIQELYWELESKQLKYRPFNLLLHGLTQKLKKLLQQNPDKAANLLVTTFGYEEDVLNMRVIEEAARAAGFTQVKHSTLEEVIFSAEEGIFMQAKTGEYTRYDFWYKFTPWDIIAYDEPELWDILEQIIRNRLCVVMNPAFSMLLQSKAIMKFMYDIAPRHAHLLKTTFKADDFYHYKYVRKPIFGRMGENISFFNGAKKAVYKTKGDFGDQETVFQELADFNEDIEEYRYQPSIYWTGEACALCFRRQDDLIIDDDAEFVGHIISTE